MREIGRRRTVRIQPASRRAAIARISTRASGNASAETPMAVQAGQGSDRTSSRTFAKLPHVLRHAHVERGRLDHVREVEAGVLEDALDGPPGVPELFLRVLGHLAVRPEADLAGTDDEVAGLDRGGEVESGRTWPGRCPER